jgi:hypothetical protein
MDTLETQAGDSEEQLQKFYHFNIEWKDQGWSVAQW